MLPRGGRNNVLARVTRTGRYLSVVFRSLIIASARRGLRPLGAVMLFAVALARCARESESAIPAAGRPIGASFLNAGQPQYRGGATSYRVVFSFGENVYGYDGANPEASLINANGVFWRVLWNHAWGGTHRCTGVAGACGTVFSVSTSGTENVLYDFSGPPDGSYPVAGLVAMNGTLYGTTAGGGTYNEGTIFSISPSGAETVLHSFGSGSDGAQPMAGLVAVHGKLYGTMLYGGYVSCSPSTDGCGTVFRISASGEERVLHRFSGLPDGESPVAALLDVKGILYGTTESGGSGGTAFSITTAGKETVLYTFPEVSDGTAPEAALVDVKGTLYGTTEGGGSADWERYSVSARPARVSACYIVLATTLPMG